MRKYLQRFLFPISCYNFCFSICRLSGCLVHMQCFWQKTPPRKKNTAARRAVIRMPEKHTCILELQSDMYRLNIQSDIYSVQRACNSIIFIECWLYSNKLQLCTQYRIIALYILHMLYMILVIMYNVNNIQSTTAYYKMYTICYSMQHNYTPYDYVCYCCTTPTINATADTACSKQVMLTDC